MNKYLLWQALLGFVTQPHDIDWRDDDHLCGLNPYRDPFEDIKRQDAITFLGPRWRGRVHCSHQYVNSRGNKTEINNG